MSQPEEKFMNKAPGPKGSSLIMQNAWQGEAAGGKKSLEPEDTESTDAVQRSGTVGRTTSLAGPERTSSFAGGARRQSLSLPVKSGSMHSGDMQVTKHASLQSTEGIVNSPSMTSNRSKASKSTMKSALASSADTGSIPWTREEFLIAGAYAFFYAIVTRLPMIFAVVHMIKVYNFSPHWCAAFFCAYCVGRMTAAYAVQYFFCMKTLVASTLAGLVAFTTIWIFQDAPWVFGCMCFVAGLAESVTGFDTLLKKECQVRDWPEKRQAMTFRFVLISSTVGSGVAYCVGGILYEAVGCGAACLLGMGAATGELVCLAIYWCWRKEFIANGFQKDTTDQSLETSSVMPQMAPLSTFEADRLRRRRESEEARNDLEWRPPTTEEEDAMLTKTVLLSVVMAMYVTPMAIGNNFAVLAYFWLVVHGIGTGTSGTLMAVGECLGVVVLYGFKIPCVYESATTFPFGSPMNICFTSGCIAVCVYLVTVPNVYICAMGSIGVHMLNAAVHSFTNELCAIASPPDEFSKWQGWAYLAKRASNCTMGFTQTLLFAVFPQLPYLVAGTVMLAWALISGAFYFSQSLAPTQVRSSILLQEEVESRLEYLERQKDSHGHVHVVVKEQCSKVTKGPMGDDKADNTSEDSDHGEKHHKHEQKRKSRKSHANDGTGTAKSIASISGIGSTKVQKLHGHKSKVQEAFMERQRQHEQEHEERTGRCSGHSNHGRKSHHGLVNCEKSWELAALCGGGA